MNESLKDERPIMIIDGLSSFIRCWAAFPQLNVDGAQFGGCIGFLKSLGRLGAQYQPKAVYVVWESGGSTRRRSIYNEYKMNRRPEKLNRFYGDDIPESEDNKKWQIETLVSLLKDLPVCQLYVPGCEGDDVIALLCRTKFAGINKVIVSSDRDFYQLLDETTHMHSLSKKINVSHEDVMNEFRVNAKNFAIAKALCGDAGDNVPGIKGLGFKTASKMFPMLGTDNDIILQDVIDYASAHRDDHKVYQRVFENIQDVRRNWKLVYLDGNMLSAQQATRINHMMDTFVPQAHKMNLIKSLISEGISDFDVDGLLYSLNSIDGIQYR